jgi:hypothetical protein
MDLDDIQKALDFMNWKMLVAIALITMAWVQYWKEYLPDVYCCGKVKIPILKIFILLSGMAVAHFIFGIAGVKSLESVILFHGVIGALFGALGYELVKGTKVALRSSSELKEPPK